MPAAGDAGSWVDGGRCVREKVRVACVCGVESSYDYGDVYEYDRTRTGHSLLAIPKQESNRGVLFLSAFGIDQGELLHGNIGVSPFSSAAEGRKMSIF